ncbi:MAG TPA: hypothetical protein QF873_00930 [Patescibacteria group bacterium]|nr:hypothetical protein [Patescibacteria group bacterium]
MQHAGGTIRFMRDPKTGDQLASLVVYKFGTLNFKWADPSRPLMRTLGEGLKITVTHIGGTRYRCVIENASVILHENVLELIAIPD